MRLSAEQRAAAKALFIAAEALAKALAPGFDKQPVEDALADVIAEGRLAAEALGLDRDAMTKRVNRRLSEDLL